jgi:TonB-linked SusC/RagA family outer membrane protein
MQELRHGKVSVMGGTEPKLNLLTAAQICRIVKLCTFILLAGCLHAFATGYGQKITLSEKDVPLTKVFKEIKRQTGYQFLYVSEQLEQASKVTIAIKDASLEEVLEQCFKGQPFGYEIKEKTIVVKPKGTHGTSTSAINETIADPITVTGKVTDAEGRPLPGANVKVKGSNIGVTTDNDGNFVLKNVSENAVLEISFVGHEMKTFTVRGAGFVNIALDQRLSLLDETVVIAYGTTTRRLSTGNVATVKAKDIETQPVSNPLLALQGRVPGLFITQSTGFAGTGVSVRIQGQNSIRKGNDPFYVIDGVPYTSQVLPTINSILGNSGSFYVGAVQGSGNPLSYINPADIESIEILKDADATAIYGSRAANGAVLITTKKGKAGETRIDLNLQSGWQKVTSKLDVLNTQEYLEMRKAAYINDGLTIPNSSTTPDNSNYDLTIWDQNKYTDWQNVLIGGTGKYSDMQMSISGGNNNTQYLVAGGYHKETTVFPGDLADKKVSLHFNLNSITTNQKFKFQISGNYLADNNALIPIDLTPVAFALAPNAPFLYNEDGSLNWEQLPNGNSTWENPLTYLNRKYNIKSNNLISNAVLSYRLLPNVELKSSFGYNNIQTNEIQTFSVISLAPERRPTSQGSAVFANGNVNTWILEPQVHYKGTIAKGKLEMLIGSSYQHENRSRQQFSATGYNSDALLEDVRSAASVRVGGSVNRHYKYIGLFGRINYNWADKYILTITARRDGSSRFGINNLFHSFGGVGAAWIFTSEPFLQKHTRIISFGKLRASYGTSGNDQIGDFQYLNLYENITGAIPYQAQGGLRPTGLSNPHLQWELTKKINLGIDIGLLNSKIDFNLNYYHNRSSNQLLPYALPIITGFPDNTINFPATLQNSGWEFSLSTTNFRKKDFEWTSSINLTIPVNKLVDFPKLETSTLSSTLVVGEPISSLKLYTFSGVNSTTGVFEFDDGKGGLTSRPDTAVAATRNLIIDLGQKFYGGFQNTFSYKGFELDILFQFVKQLGRNNVLGNLFPGQFFGTSNIANQPAYVLGGWQKDGDITNAQRYTTNYPSDLLYGFSAAESSNLSYSDASYVRLKNLALSWFIPSSISNRLHTKSVRFSIMCQNLLTFSNYKGLDPETKSSTLPPLRILTVGLKVTL